MSNEGFSERKLMSAKGQEQTLITAVNHVRFRGQSRRRSRPSRRSANSHKQTLALAKEVEHWSLTTLREKLVKIGAKVVGHGGYVTFQMAEVAVPRDLFQKILRLINALQPRPSPA